MLGVAEKKKILDRYNDLAMNYSDETADEMTKLQDEIEAKGLWDLDSQVDQAMDALGCPADDGDVTMLSGGERRRVALCKLLLEQPDMLLLDEPTNHLDAETVNWLEGHLRNYPGAILIVTHDRYFLDNVTGWILELDRGRGIPYEGNYTSWLKQKQKRLAQESGEDKARQRALEAESDWIASSPKARQAKSKARIQRYEELVAKQNDKAPTTAQIIIPVAERLGNNVIDFDHISKAFGDRLLIDDLSFKLPPGGIVGVIGPNGAGKTTLFRMITGQDKSDNGSIDIGESVQLGYVDQSRDALHGEKTVWEEVSEGNEVIYLGKREINSRAYCSAFNFKGADQQKRLVNYRVVNVIACILLKCLRAAPMFCCLTSQPMILMSIHCARLKRLWWILRVAQLLSRMIASSSIASQPIFSPMKARVMLNGLRETSPITKKIKNVVWASIVSFLID